MMYECDCVCIVQRKRRVHKKFMLAQSTSPRCSERMSVDRVSSLGRNVCKLEQNTCSRVVLVAMLLSVTKTHSLAQTSRNYALDK